nr:MAG TPA: hypothetical protein [Caudoviricetes sp.]
METNEMVITIPEGYEIDKENSTFECIKFKKIKEINTWKDIPKLQGFYILGDSAINKLNEDWHDVSTNDENINIFINKKYVKASLALAQISQLMPYYGGEITDEEWKDPSIPKYNILCGLGDIIGTVGYNIKHITSFHTREQRDKFMSIPENIQLVKDLYMVD